MLFSSLRRLPLSSRAPASSSTSPYQSACLKGPQPPQPRLQPPPPPPPSVANQRPSAGSSSLAFAFFSNSLGACSSFSRHSSTIPPARRWFLVLFSTDHLWLGFRRPFRSVQHLCLTLLPFEGSQIACCEAGVYPNSRKRTLWATSILSLRQQ